MCCIPTFLPCCGSFVLHSRAQRRDWLASRQQLGVCRKAFPRKPDIALDSYGGSSTSTGAISPDVHLLPDKSLPGLSVGCGYWPLNSAEVQFAWDTPLVRLRRATGIVSIEPLKLLVMSFGTYAHPQRGCAYVPQDCVHLQMLACLEQKQMAVGLRLERLKYAGFNF